VFIRGSLIPGLPPPPAGDMLRRMKILVTVIGNAVNWEAEQLYGVPGRGPFNEF